MTNFKDKLNYFKSLEATNSSSELSEALTVPTTPQLRTIEEYTAQESSELPSYQDVASAELSISFKEISIDPETETYKSPLIEHVAAEPFESIDELRLRCDELKAQNLKLNMALLQYKNLPPVKDEEKEALKTENESLKQAIKVLQSSINELIDLNNENSSTVLRLQDLISNKL